jgi:hypothetical protein
VKIFELQSFIKKALVLIEKKQLKSNESIIANFTNEYKRVLNVISREGETVSKKEFNKMKSFTRMYMETSSDYNQEFLHYMGKFESMIKKYFS